MSSDEQTQKCVWTEEGWAYCVFTLSVLCSSAAQYKHLACEFSHNLFSFSSLPLPVPHPAFPSPQKMLIPSFSPQMLLLLSPPFPLMFLLHPLPLLLLPHLSLSMLPYSSPSTKAHRPQRQLKSLLAIPSSRAWQAIIHTLTHTRARDCILWQCDGKRVKCTTFVFPQTHTSRWTAALHQMSIRHTHGNTHSISAQSQAKRQTTNWPT